MKLFRSQKSNQFITLNVENVFPVSMQTTILNKVAATLKLEIINELNNSNVPTKLKDEIEQSLVIETPDETNIHLKINTTELNNIEYGDNQSDENPIVLRSQYALENSIREILRSEFNLLKTKK